MAPKKPKDPSETPPPGEGVTPAEPTDEATQDTAAVPEGQTPAIAVNAQYVKDLSFEAPSAPAIFAEMQEAQPDIRVNVDVNATPLQDTIYEVVLHVAAECKTKDKTAFILELSYGGVFTLTVPQEHIQPVLLIECPRLLFPFARNIVADATRDGGFPPLMLSPMDFLAMYQAQVRQQAQKAAESEPTPEA